MSQIEKLVKAYEQTVRHPWEPNLSGPEKVWFLIYVPPQERRLRLRISEFETATKKAGHGWKLLDLTDSFAIWMANHKYREAYFQEPEYMELALKTDFAGAVETQIRSFLTNPDVDDNTVVAVTGIASLFGLIRFSSVLEPIASSIQGRLLVFFPGQWEESNYRLLDARDGWNYLARPITVSEGG